MKSRYYFRITNDWWMISLNKPAYIDLDLLSFHWEDNIKFISILGFSFILERGTYAPVRKKK